MCMCRALSEKKKGGAPGNLTRAKQIKVKKSHSPSLPRLSHRLGSNRSCISRDATCVGFFFVVVEVVVVVVVVFVFVIIIIISFV